MATASPLASPLASPSLLGGTGSILPTRRVVSSPVLHFQCPKLSPSVSLSHSFSSSPSSFTLGIPQKCRFHTEEYVSQDVQASTDDVTNSVENSEEGSVEKSSRTPIRPCELYVCNLPKSCGILELMELFKPYGTIHSVEVSRNSETGESKGCGYVKMSSMEEARAAIAALDGTDADGHEMRVGFSIETSTERRKLEALNSNPKKSCVLESPYRVYVGNLPWAIQPDDLSNLFSHFGTVLSAKVLHDRKGGMRRTYGFLSFSSEAECETAMSFSGTEFRGRELVIRKGQARSSP